MITKERIPTSKAEYFGPDGFPASFPQGFWDRADKEYNFRKAVNDMALTFYLGIHNSSGVDQDDVEESIGKFVKLAADYLGIERVDFNPSEAYEYEQEKSDPDNPPRTDEDAYYD